MTEPGYVLEHPNRDKASSKATKAVVVLLLLISAGLTMVVLIGGWDAIEGAKMLNAAYALLYVVIAFFVARWRRGVLPVAAALAIILLIFAAVSTGQWFDRDKIGFNDPALDESVLGLITGIMIPVQVLLIFFAMRGFAQEWNVEVERPIDGHRGDDGGPSGGHGEPAPAGA